MHTVAPLDQQFERLHIYRPTGFAQIECLIGPPTPYSGPRHWHEELEIALNIGRTWRQDFRGQSVLIGVDDLLLTPPGEPHEASSPEIGTAPYFGMRISQESLAESVVDLLERRTPVLHFRDGVITDLSFRAAFLGLHRALRDTQISRLAQEALWQRFVTLLHHLSAAPGVLPSPRPAPAAMRQVQAYLHAHYRDNTALATLAALVQMRPFALVRSFRATVGMPPHAYQTQIRIVQAKRLLRAGHSPAEIAWLTGFASQSHLGRHFKRLVGITPGQYVADGQGCKNVIERSASPAV